MTAEWYFAQAGRTHGPVPLDELRQSVANGSVGQGDPVWHPSLTEWTPAGRVPALSLRQSAGVGAAHAMEPHDGLNLAAPSATAAMPTTGYPQAAATSRPQPVLAYAQPSSDTMMLTPRAIAMLQQTKPWVRFLSVLTLVFAGFAVVGGLLATVGMSMAASRGGSNVPATVFLVYVAMGLLYMAPAIYLSRYASRIGDLVNRRQSRDLELALEAQKSFWKFCGILAIVLVCFYGVLIGVVGFAAAIR